tara:strand:- start:96 stop:1541 length:1446 start_codon:yes stop_codon:yes gene_type:complete
MSVDGNVILTRYLFNLLYVRLSLLDALLIKDNLNEVLYWMSEYYYSGFNEECWEWCIIIAMDFYALSNPLFFYHVIKKYFKRNVTNKDDDNADGNNGSEKMLFNIGKSLFKKKYNCLIYNLLKQSVTRKVKIPGIRGRKPIYFKDYKDIIDDCVRSGYKDEKKVYYFIRCLYSINKGIGVNKESYENTIKNVASIIYNINSVDYINEKYNNEMELIINICEKFYSSKNQNIKCIRKLIKVFKLKGNGGISGSGELNKPKHIYNFEVKIIKRLLLINIIQMCIKNNEGIVGKEEIINEINITWKKDTSHVLSQEDYDFIMKYNDSKPVHYQKEVTYESGEKEIKNFTLKGCRLLIHNRPFKMKDSIKRYKLYRRSDWNGVKVGGTRIRPDLMEIKDNWHYYSSLSPIWKERYKKHDLDFDEEHKMFINHGKVSVEGKTSEDKYEDFMEDYGYDFQEMRMSELGCDLMFRIKRVMGNNEGRGQ